MPDLYTLGEVMALFLASDTDDVATAQSFELSVAGAEANVAVAITRLGLTATLLSRLGNDKLGGNLLSCLVAEGVDTSLIKQVKSYTGALVRNRGEINPLDVTYLRSSSAGSTISADDVAESDIKISRWVHLTGISVAISQSSSLAVAKTMDLARKNNIPISFDLNIRRKLWTESDAAQALALIVRDVDLVVGGVDEFAVVWGSQDPEINLSIASKFGVKTCIMTAGDKKMRILHQGLRFDIEPEIMVTIDPVGSGDAFVGGTIAGILGGLSIEDAVRQGSRCGALVASQLGDWTGLPLGSAGVIQRTLEKSS